MAIEFNITTDNKWFLGEDKVLQFTIFQIDGVTPLDIAGLPLTWQLRETDKAADPALITKSIDATGASTTGVTIVGTYNANPALNTQRLRLAFGSDETDPLVTIGYTLKPGVEVGVRGSGRRISYRHSLKRMDAGNENVLSYGSITFMQSTVR